jgi:cyclopropane-fatty-acyl-phospholipid synthase
MFEHMKNYQILMSKVASWLKEDGLLFVHILCHANYPYNFGSKDSNSWMAKYFFASGTMPR